MRDTISRDSLVVSRLEHKVFTGTIDESLSELPDFLLELLGKKDFVRETVERQVEIICDFSIP